MPRTLVSYLASQKRRWNPIPESELMAVLDEHFEGGWLLPAPYKIYSADENAPPGLGFPVARSGIFTSLGETLDGWLDAWIDERNGKERAKPSRFLNDYANRIRSICENALLSNFLADYHGIFWLAHSCDVAATFSSITRKLARVGGTLGSTVGRLQRTAYNEWAEAVRSTLSEVGQKLDGVLGGEQVRGLELFDLFASNRLVFTMQEIDPDFRGVRLWLEGERHNHPESVFELLKLLEARTHELADADEGFRWALQSIGWRIDDIDQFSMLDRSLRKFVAGHPSFGTRADAATLATLETMSEHLAAFEILDRLRRGVLWMEEVANGKIVEAGNENRAFSRSTRPLHFDKAGILDPLVHRFGMVYDLTEFTQTLGEIAKAGVRKEILSYRQMFLFQKRLDRITSGHRLNFEKFLGDGAFYTTRKALRLVLAAIDLQEYYDLMAQRGFVFNRGIRIALNYGYYRLLPLNVGKPESESLVEFYGPGIVELSRLTTGKVSRDLDELRQYLINHGYEPAAVRRFFAPLERSSRREERKERRHFAYIDEHGQLVNEGIVATSSLVEQLDDELLSEDFGIFEIDAAGNRWAAFMMADHFVALRPIGRLNLKGLPSVDALEVAGFSQDCIREVLPRENSLAATLRGMALEMSGIQANEEDEELAICAFATTDDTVVVIGCVTDDSAAIRRPVRLPGSQLERLLGLEFPLGVGVLESRRNSLVQLYSSLRDTNNDDDLPIAPLRLRDKFQAFVLGSAVRELV